MTIDAHFHCWQLARGDYSWLDPVVHPALAVIYRDMSVHDWQALSGAHGVSGGVLVQAAPTAAETSFLLRQADVNPAVLGVVGWVDLLAADAPDQIQALARHPRLKGLRPMLQDIDDPCWILQAELSPALSAISESGLVFDALVRSAHLPHILTLARRHPDLRLVIDHAAKPAIALNEWQPWADGIAQLASETTTMCKLSGLLTEAGCSPRPDTVRPWAEHVLSCFGPARVVWGSDWPVLELSASYPQWWDLTQQLLAHLSAPEQAAIMSQNARRLYRL